LQVPPEQVLLIGGGTDSARVVVTDRRTGEDREIVRIPVTCKAENGTEEIERYRLEFTPFTLPAGGVARPLISENSAQRTPLTEAEWTMLEGQEGEKISMVMFLMAVPIFLAGLFLFLTGSVGPSLLTLFAIIPYAVLVSLGGLQRVLTAPVRHRRMAAFLEERAPVQSLPGTDRQQTDHQEEGHPEEDPSVLQVLSALTERARARAGHVLPAPAPTPGDSAPGDPPGNAPAEASVTQFPAALPVLNLDLPRQAIRERALPETLKRAIAVLEDAVYRYDLLEGPADLTNARLRLTALRRDVLLGWHRLGQEHTEDQDAEQFAQDLARTVLEGTDQELPRLLRAESEARQALLDRLSVDSSAGPKPF